jgi:hypothetical protein
LLLVQSTPEKIIKVVVTFTIPAYIERPLVWVALLYRRLRSGYPYRKIPLTRGKFAIVDPDDFDRLNQHKWYASKSSAKGGFYAARCLWDKVNKKKRTVKMHRQILNPPPPLLVDHINRNGLDNRKANLRPATKSQNTVNRPIRKPKGAHSKYIGVTFQKSNKKWQAQIRAKGIPRIIGYFEKEIDAARAYDKAAKKYHRQFAVLNFTETNYTRDS